MISPHLDKALDDLAHMLWAAAQTPPGQGIEDAVARIKELLINPPALAKAPEDIDGWIVEHPEYGQWFISRQSVADDWLFCERQENPNAKPIALSSDVVNIWFHEQITWHEVHQYGTLLARPNMVAIEQAFFNAMNKHCDTTDHFKVTKHKALNKAADASKK